MKLAKLYQIEKFRQRAAALEREWNSERKSLLRLPNRLGYKTLQELISVLSFIQAEAGGPTATQRQRKNRAKITPEMREQVRVQTLAGRTAKEIATELNLSVPSINNIRSALKLVKRKRG